MNRITRRVAIVSALAVVGVGFALMSPAQASYESCPSTHVAYNPVTGTPMRAGATGHPLGDPNQLMWAWACVDDGGLTGATSVGTAGYTGNDGGPGYIQHLVVCADPLGPCRDLFTGVTLVGQSVTIGGAAVTPCVAAANASMGDRACVPVSVTVTGTAVSTPVVGPSGGTCVQDACLNGRLGTGTGGVTVSITPPAPLPAVTETVPVGGHCVVSFDGSPCTL